MDSSRDRSNTAGETIADPTEENDIEANSTIALSVTTFFFLSSSLNIISKCTLNYPAYFFI